MESEKSVGLEKKDAINQARWRVAVGKISAKVGVNPATTIYGDKPGLMMMSSNPWKAL